MGKVIYLKVAKVGSQNSDMTTSIERTEVTLEEGKNFNNFVKHLHVQNDIDSEPPHVTKVVIVKNGKVIDNDVDKAPYQKQVEAALDKMKNPNKVIDYKAESEKQSKLNADLLERLEALENKGNEKSDDREALEDKANELEISFRSTIGDEKLLKKIQDIEPDYKL